MAFRIHGGRSVLGDGQALLGGLAMPFHGFACVLAARSGAEAAGTHMGAVALDTAANDAARSPDGSSENGSGENGSGKKESARNGMDDSSDLRTGLQRVIKKTHSPRTTAGEHGAL